jgi:hypothetical protein
MSLRFQKLQISTIMASCFPNLAPEEETRSPFTQLILYILCTQSNLHSLLPPFFRKSPVIKFHFVQRATCFARLVLPLLRKSNIYPNVRFAGTAEQE